MATLTVFNNVSHPVLDDKGVQRKDKSGKPMIETVREPVASIDTALIDSISESKLSTGINTFVCADVTNNIKSLQGFKKTFAQMIEPGAETVWIDGDYKIVVKDAVKFLSLVKELQSLVVIENRPQRGRQSGSGKKLTMTDL